MKDASNREYMWHPHTTLDGRYLALYITKDTSRVRLYESVGGIELTTPTRKTFSGLQISQIMKSVRTSSGQK